MRTALYRRGYQNFFPKAKSRQLVFRVSFSFPWIQDTTSITQLPHTTGGKQFHEDFLESSLGTFQSQCFAPVREQLDALFFSTNIFKQLSCCFCLLPS